MGIAPEDIDKIFERFYRTDRSRDREKGGSGLAVSCTEKMKSFFSCRASMVIRPYSGV